MNEVNRAELAEEHLQAAWRELRNNATNVAIARITGALDVLVATKVFGALQRELWIRRISTCPGHDDEGGRVWCAYCGNLPKESE